MPILVDVKINNCIIGFLKISRIEALKDDIENYTYVVNFYDHENERETKFALMHKRVPEIGAYQLVSEALQIVMKGYESYAEIL